MGDFTYPLPSSEIFRGKYGWTVKKKYKQLRCEIRIATRRTRWNGALITLCYIKAPKMCLQGYS